MSSRTCRIYTIPNDEPFLRVLATALRKELAPHGEREVAPLDIAAVQVLLPTRRACIGLQDMLQTGASKDSPFLPRIFCLGETSGPWCPPPALQLLLPASPSFIGRHLDLVRFVRQWARLQPHHTLARQISEAPDLALELAQSLSELLDLLEIEELSPSRLEDLYSIEFAKHRESILSLLRVIGVDISFPTDDKIQGGRFGREAMMLRNLADYFLNSRQPNTVIAAGLQASTPAQRHLLSTIARLPRGAVVLAGLDQQMDAESWNCISPQHPQYDWKLLLDLMEFPRDQVERLTCGGATRRSWLSGEIMRPPETSEQWAHIIPGRKKLFQSIIDDIELVEARDSQHEARIVALALRQSVEIPGRTACLISPDDNLRKAVANELRSLGVFQVEESDACISDTGSGRFFDLILQLALSGFSLASLIALLRSPYCNLGLTPHELCDATRVIELALLRRQSGHGLSEGLVDQLKAARKDVERDERSHPLLQSISKQEWAYAEQVLTSILSPLKSLMSAVSSTFVSSLAHFVKVFELMAGDFAWKDESGQRLRTLLADLSEQSHDLASMPITSCAKIIRYWLRNTSVPSASGSTNAISLLKPGDARLLSFDLVILGGLNEGRWPHFPEAGPWLNRPMRLGLNVQLPEQAIGQSALAFCNAFSSSEMILTWARRIGEAPALPSRWILRLQNLLRAAGLGEWSGKDTYWEHLIARIDPQASSDPLPKPRPAPPASSRPRRYSVTQIEQLIKDPYAFYARKILRLEPLSYGSLAPAAKERGLIVHSAIADFVSIHGAATEADSLQRFLALGEARFGSLMNHPYVRAFWWPQFRNMATWFVEQESRIERDLLSTRSEIPGAMRLRSHTADFAISCRADRIDLMKKGIARVIDYKTGIVPSMKQVEAGFFPQLTLQAAILMEGGFSGLPALRDGGIELQYVKLSTKAPFGEVITLDLKPSIADCIQSHLQGLESLLSDYASADTSYLPRLSAERADETGDYDHLSRRMEWTLAG